MGKPRNSPRVTEQENSSLSVPENLCCYVPPHRPWKPRHSVSQSVKDSS